MSNGRYTSLTRQPRSDPAAHKIVPPSSDDDWATGKPNKKKRKVFVYESKQPVTPPVSKNDPTSPTKLTIPSSPVKDTETVTLNDFESGLIDIALLKSSPQKQDEGLKSKQLQKSPVRQKQDELARASDSKKENSATDTDALHLSPFDIFTGLSGKPEHEVKKTYRDKEIPSPIVSKRQLVKRIDSMIPTIKQLLRSKEFNSIYYQLARAQQEKSTAEAITEHDKLRIDWDTYTSGYFGINRQLMMSTIIQSRCRQELQNAINHKVIKYWGIEGFSTYVLANEVAIQLAMEDIQYTYEEASEMLQSTVDYGKYIADKTTVADDLHHGELLGDETTEFLKEFVNKKRSEKALPKQSGPLLQHKTTQNSQKSLLDELVASESDESGDSDNN